MQGESVTVCFFGDGRGRLRASLNLDSALAHYINVIALDRTRMLLVVVNSTESFSRQRFERI